MKVRAVPQDPRWRRLAVLLDVRGLLAVLLLQALFQFCTLPSFSADKLDRWLFRFGVSLQSHSVDTSAFVRVDVPEVEFRRFVHDPASASGLIAFLSQWSATAADGVIVLPEPLWTSYTTHSLVEANAPALLASSRDETAGSLKKLVDATRVFQSMVSNGKPLRAWPQENARSSGASRLWWQALLGSARNMDHALYALPEGTAAGQDLPLTKVGHGVLERPLLWKGAGGQREDARLALFMAQQDVNRVEWLSGTGIQVRESLLRTAPDGTFLPHFSVDSGALPTVIHYPLDALVGQEARRMLNGKVVVIGVANDAQADDLLYSTLSLQSGHIASLPVSHVWIYPLALVLLFVYLLAFPYLPLKATALVSGLTAFAILLAQQIVLLVHGAWFPVAGLLYFLGAGHLLMLCWIVRRTYFPLGQSRESVPADNRRRASPAVTQGQARLGSSLGTARIAPVIGDDTEGVDEATVVLSASSPAGLRPVGGAAMQGGMRRSLGRYEIRRELGRGAMGVVYLGFDPKISREVAIKTLHYNHFEPAELQSIKDRFFREAAAAGRLSHPHIVKVLDVGEEPDLAFIAMDYVRGQPLSAYTRKENLLDVELVYWIMAMVADAVDYAHRQGIVHRDIKPSNILFDSETNEVKVADFGIARFMDGSATRTRTGDVLGSPLYMSPEQLKGDAVTGSTDIFSLGVTFYQLLTGELPFKGENIANLSLQIMQCRFRPVDEVRPGLPDSARRITNKAIQKNASQRYTTALEMAEALQRAYSRDFT